MKKRLLQVGIAIGIGLAVAEVATKGGLLRAALAVVRPPAPVPLLGLGETGPTVYRGDYYKQWPGQYELPSLTRWFSQTIYPYGDEPKMLRDNPGFRTDVVSWLNTPRLLIDNYADWNKFRLSQGQTGRTDPGPVPPLFWYSLYSGVHPANPNPSNMPQQP